MLCMNCDLATATLNCVECNEPMCQDCSEIHVKVKAFKNHSFEAKKSVRQHICGNCEEQVAKFYCKHCDEVDRYLCLGCSVLHTKVKAFRGHLVVKLGDEGLDGGNSDIEILSSSSSFPSSSKLSACRNFDDVEVWAQGHVERLYSDVMDRSFQDTQFWWSTSLICGMGIIYYIVTKVMFGGLSTFVNIVLAIIMYYRATRTRNTTNGGGGTRPSGSTNRNSNFGSSSSSRSSRGCASVDIQTRHDFPAISSSPSISGTSRSVGGGSGSNGVTASSDNFEFKDEFPYPITGKNAQFRPRTKFVKPGELHHRKKNRSKVALKGDTTEKTTASIENID